MTWPPAVTHVVTESKQHTDSWSWTKLAVWSEFHPPSLIGVGLLYVGMATHSHDHDHDDHGHGETEPVTDRTHDNSWSANLEKP